MIQENVLKLIGNTPLIKLQRASEKTGCNIYGKAEFLNPGQSIKDRAAIGIVRAALKSGDLHPSGTIVEGTAGNTGIGLSLVGRSLGLDVVIVMPDTQSSEKKQTIRSLGSTLVEVPAVPYKDCNNYVKYSKRLAEKLNKDLKNGAFWANQFDNIANKESHIYGTAKEINAQLNGEVHGFICAVGSGGTLAGVSEGLRISNPDIKIGLADPDGAALFSYFTTGKLVSSGTSISEGIGQGRITKNLESLDVDYAFNIPDEEGLRIIFDLIEEEGLCLGLSSGINISGAIRMAEKIGPGKNIVTILCDYGFRYAEKIFNPSFLKSKGLSVPRWMENSKIEVPDVFIKT